MIGIISGTFSLNGLPVPATGHYTGGFDRAPCDSETIRIR
jgi:hypothetical protein